MNTLANRTLMPALAALLSAGMLCDAAEKMPPGGLHELLYKRISKGPKMDITAATFFGTKSPEEFVGVAVSPDGQIVAAGNSWGPTFVSNVEVQVLGPDEPWPVPLYPRGVERDKDGKLFPPPDRSPNRTGFVVRYSGDLRKIEKVIRFGWGTASITALAIMRNGDTLVAGRATRSFSALADSAKLKKTFPPPTPSGYGPVEYEKNMQPGDCYVARFDRSFKQMDWVWLFEGHQLPPEQILEGPNGLIVFNCRGLKSISSDGQEAREVMKTTGGTWRPLAISPVDGSILVGGEREAPRGTGREPWRQPVMDLYTKDGAHFARFYDWEGALAGHDSFRLTAGTGVRSGCFLPNGDILAYLWSSGPNTVAARSPVDLQAKLSEYGLATDLPDAAPGASMAHFVRLNPTNYNDCSYAEWSAYTQTKARGIAIKTVSGTRDGRVMVTGSSPPFLAQTTLRWYRDTDHYRWDPDYRQDGGGIEVAKNGWPAYIGLGGKEGFSLVFSPGFTNVLWSSAIALCDHTAMAECPRGIVAVSRCTGACAEDGRTPLFVNHDIGNWSDFLVAFRNEASKPPPSPAKRLWTFISDGLKDSIVSWDPKAPPEVELQKRMLFEINRLVMQFPNFYDEDCWKGCEFSEYEQKLLAAAKAGTISKKDLPDLNRRLLEHGFPQYVFRCPKTNYAPVLNAVQEQFGGGYSDGHIYLLEHVSAKK